MSILKLIINKESDDRGFKTTVNIDDQVWSYPVEKTPDAWRSAESLDIYLQDKRLPLPEKVLENVRVYLCGLSDVLASSITFTCHQFADYLHGQYDIRSHTAKKTVSGIISELAPGDFVNLRNVANSLHTAIYLGSGLFISKYGRNSGLRVNTLNQMLVQPYSTCTEVYAASCRTNVYQLYASLHRPYNGIVLYAALLGLECTSAQGIFTLKADDIHGAFKSMSRIYHPDKSDSEYSEYCLKLFTLAKDTLEDPIARDELIFSLASGRDMTLISLINSQTKCADRVNYYKAVECIIKGQEFDGCTVLAEKVFSEPAYRHAMATIEASCSKDTIEMNVSRYATPDNLFAQKNFQHYPVTIFFDGQSRPLGSYEGFKSTSETRIGSLVITNASVSEIRYSKETYADVLKAHPSTPLSADVVLAAISAFERVNLHEAKWGGKTRKMQPYNAATHFLLPLMPVVMRKIGDTFIATVVAIYLGHGLFQFQAGDDYQADSLGAFLAEGYRALLFLDDQGAPIQSLEGLIVHAALFRVSNTVNLAEPQKTMDSETTERIKQACLDPGITKRYTDIWGYLQALTGGTSNHFHETNMLTACISTDSCVVLACENRVLQIALHIENHLYLTLIRGYLRVLDLLQLVHLYSANTIYGIDGEENNDGKRKVKLTKYMVLAGQPTKRPLLYEILQIPYSITALTDVTHTAIKHAYDHHGKTESSAGAKVLRDKAYELLSQEAYRIQYAFLIMSGHDIELAQLLQLDNLNIENALLYLEMLNELVEINQEKVTDCAEAGVLKKIDSMFVIHCALASDDEAYQQNTDKYIALSRQLKAEYIYNYFVETLRAIFLKEQSAVYYQVLATWMLLLPEEIRLPKIMWYNPKWGELQGDAACVKKLYQFFKSLVSPDVFTGFLSTFQTHLRPMLKKSEIFLDILEDPDLNERVNVYRSSLYNNAERLQLLSYQITREAADLLFGPQVEAARIIVDIENGSMDQSVLSSQLDKLLKFTDGSEDMLTPFPATMSAIYRKQHYTWKGIQRDAAVFRNAVRGFFQKEPTPPPEP